MGRGNRDEDYVLDLCDRALRERGLRQHRFEWLVGDPSATGQVAQLPVDGYWPEANVVVEYRERQHDEPVPHFDKPDQLTVSGVHRGVQRALYDARRDELIPAHGLRLVIIRPGDLDSTSRGRLRRSEANDLAAIRHLLRDHSQAVPPKEATSASTGPLVAGRLDLYDVMKALGRDRPVFHSEADLQHSFARVLWEMDPAIQTRLEVRQGDQREHLDLLAIGPETRTAIEFKYRTRTWEGSVGDDIERYALRNHSATDLARREYVFDIARLERFTTAPRTNGIAMLLTNEPALWAPPSKPPETRDRDFRIHEDQLLTGTLLWGGGDYPNNTRHLRGRYNLHWSDYSLLHGAGGRFRYLALEIVGLDP